MGATEKGVERVLFHANPPKKGRGDQKMRAAVRKPDKSVGLKVRCEVAAVFVGGRAGEESRFDAVFHAEAGAFDEDGFAVMEDTVEDSGSDGAVVVEDARPLLEGLVGS